jgi:alkylated DNA nucleotide flippase Atl1
MAYGDVAAYLGRGGPRQVAQVMSRWGSEVPWWRVLRANGTCAPEVADRQRPKLRREKVPFIGDRVDIATARWLGGPPKNQEDEQDDKQDAGPND